MGKQHSKDDPADTEICPENFTELALLCKYTSSELEEWHSNFIQKHRGSVITSEQVVEAYLGKFSS